MGGSGSYSEMARELKGKKQAAGNYMPAAFPCIDEHPPYAATIVGLDKNVSIVVADEPILSDRLVCFLANPKPVIFVLICVYLKRKK